VIESPDEEFEDEEVFAEEAEGAEAPRPRFRRDRGGPSEDELPIESWTSRAPETPGLPELSARPGFRAGIRPELALTLARGFR